MTKGVGKVTNTKKRKGWKGWALVVKEEVDEHEAVEVGSEEDPVPTAHGNLRQSRRLKHTRT